MPINNTPSTSVERKLLFIETLLNTTDEASKISDESILSGIAGGVAKVAGKAEKDIAILVASLFPDTAYGSQLDVVAANMGIAPRLGALGSSTYVRITATAGTVYLVNTVTFRSTSGIRFTLDADFTVPSFGFGYAKVSSVENGVKSNVDPLTISQVSPQPNGHLNVINEYKADGGRDAESDEILRIRIKDAPNKAARGTLSMLEQLFITINPKVLKLYNYGQDAAGKIVLGVHTQNGSNLSNTELDALLAGSLQYFNLNELRPFGTTFIGIKLMNVQVGFIDLFFRVKLNDSANPDEVRKSIQVAVSKYVDPRFFNPTTQKIEWDNLLEIVKNTNGVDYVPDQYFYPRSDLSFPVGVIPRLRGFLMLDLNGTVISNFQGTLSPEFYPNAIDTDYITTVLNIN